MKKVVIAIDSFKDVYPRQKLEKQLPKVFVPYTRNVKSSACP